MVNRNGAPTGDRSSKQHGNKGPISRRRVLQLAGVGVAGATVAATTGSAQETNRLEIVASGKSVDYSFTATGSIQPVTNSGFTSTESDEESVVENDDGTVTATGRVKKGYADAFSFTGDVISFTPTDGNYRLYLNGTKISREELVTEQTVQRENTYSFEGAGDSWSDYYLEVQDGGDLIASTIDGAVIEPDFHWISDDGTKAAGRVDPGERHAYAFDNLVVDVTIEGEADPYVNGNPSDLSWYPQPGATGDGWKSGFPWQEEVETAEDRENTYSFEGAGDSWSDYYLEVQDGGDLIAVTLDGAVVEPDFHWISDDGTKAAGRVDPGERHAYAFDNLVVDVTIEGEADPYVNGNPSDLSWYPQPGATGDEWKGGFPWQDEEETTTTSDGPAVGGGSGYGNTVTESDADTVVRSHSELSDALSGASAGDVVFVPGSEAIDLGYGDFYVPDGVTLASDRGVDGSSGAYLYTENEADVCVVLNGSARLTGVRLAGPHPGDDWGGDSSANAVDILGDSEIDNCEIWGFSYSGINVDGGDSAHIHHSIIRENNKSGLGYGISVSAGTPIIEYNYFNYNRHSVATAGDNPGYVVRHNHFGPTEVMHNIDMHHPAGVRYDVHNNIVETVRREWDDNLNHAVNVRGVPDDVASIRDNWFFNDNAPDAGGSPDSGGQTIVQENVSEWTNVDFWGNNYGKDANVTYSDIIPGYDGSRSP